MSPGTNASDSEAVSYTHLLFIWVTAEEKGLLGSKFFAAHPTEPATSMIADINTDMFLPIIPLKVLTVYGLSESDLGDRIKQVADRLGLSVEPDPEPLENIFIRSDQYNFVRRGIPSVTVSYTHLIHRELHCALCPA